MTVTRDDIADWITLQDVVLVRREGPTREREWRGEEWEHDVWTFRVQGKGHAGRPPTGVMAFVFRTGVAHPEPTLVDCITAFAGDAYDYHCYDDWREFAENFEPSVDDITYREVQRYQSTWRECGRVFRNFNRLFGDAWRTELIDMKQEAGL